MTPDQLIPNHLSPLTEEQVRALVGRVDHTTRCRERLLESRHTLEDLAVVHNAAPDADSMDIAQAVFEYEMGLVGRLAGGESPDSIRQELRARYSSHTDVDTGEAE